MRGKPRDLHDIWLLLRRGVEPDLTSVERRLALSGRDWERQTLEETIKNLRADRERDLLPLLPQFVPYELVLRDVETLLK